VADSECDGLFCYFNLQHPERDVLTTVYSTGDAPWDADDYMLPVITDDPLLQFGTFFSLYLHEA